jgi:methylmalonyl-CoA/ethylmalonyl-CoA epimerase
MKDPISLTGFIQIAIVVEDIEAAIDAWCELFDAPRPEVRVTEAVANEINRGEDVLCSHHDGAVSGGRSLAAAQ